MSAVGLARVSLIINLKAQRDYGELMELMITRVCVITVKLEKLMELDFRKIVCLNLEETL